jgi:BolA family transcriptional regulator, general stress-responsive regulator
MNSDRVEQIRSLLQDRLQPLELSVLDESAAHAGHQGAAGGAGHFRARIVSTCFCGLTLVQRHRLVHDALAPLFASQIHALALQTICPDEN